MSISALALRAPENRDAASSDGGHLRGTPQRGHVSPALVCLDFYVLTAGKTRGSFSVAAALSQLGQTGYRFNGLRVVCWGGWVEGLEHWDETRLGGSFWFSVRPKCYFNSPV